jgi:hypothetical protein
MATPPLPTGRLRYTRRGARRSRVPHGHDEDDLDLRFVITLLGPSARQVQRLKGRLRRGDAPALCHHGRGRPSPRRLAAAVREQVAQLMHTGTAGSTIALTEKLREEHQLW